MKLVFTRHLLQLSEAKSIFQRPELYSLPGAQGGILAMRGEKNKGVWHMPFECWERWRLEENRR